MTALCSRRVPRLVCLRMPCGPGGKVGKEGLSHMVARARLQLASGIEGCDGYPSIKAPRSLDSITCTKLNL